MKKRLVLSLLFLGIIVFTCQERESSIARSGVYGATWQSTIAVCGLPRSFLARNDSYRQLFPRECDSLSLINFVEGFAVLQFLIKKVRESHRGPSS